MFLRITFDRNDVVSREDDTLVIKCHSHQNPKLPAFVSTFEQDPTKNLQESKPAKDARYVRVTPRGGIKLGKNTMRGF